MKLITETECQMKYPWWICHDAIVRTDFERCGKYWICDVCKRIITPRDLHKMTLDKNMKFC